LGVALSAEEDIACLRIPKARLHLVSNGAWDFYYLCMYEDGVSGVDNVGFSVCKQNHQQIVATKCTKQLSQEHKKYMIAIQIQTIFLCSQGKVLE
jgi:hypothetical protein